MRANQPDRRVAKMRSLPIVASTMTNACGVGTHEVQRALQSGTSGLRRNDFEPAAPLATWIGRVEAIDESRMPEAYADYDCRNNRLAQVALEQDGFVAAVRRAAQRYGDNRVGVFVGTTTSGILATELAYRAIVRREAGADSALSPDLPMSSQSVCDDGVRARLPRPPRHRGDDFHGLLVECQGVRGSFQVHSCR